MLLKNRTHTVVVNSFISFLTILIQIILGFIVRKVFINELGVTYLGYHSVFTNILQFLNLAELGIGVAITSFLYEPLSNNERSKINALMSIYKQFYSFVAFSVLSIGAVVSLFLPIIISDYSCSLFVLEFYYFIFLLGAVSSYFVAYKRVLLIADQRSYFINFIDTILFILISICQIIVLVYYESFSIFLFLQIIRNIIANIVLSYYVDKNYTLNLYNYDNNTKESYKRSIKNFIKDVFVSRIGAAIFYGSDSIILSIFKGVVTVGYYSNYALIITQLNSVVGQVLSSIQSTFANYLYSDVSLESKYKMTQNYLFANFYIANVCFILFIHLVQPFICIVFGKNMLLSLNTVYLLGITVYLGILLQFPSQIFVIFKLFKMDKYVILCSMSINIILSTFLVIKIGINGVIIGTIVASFFYIIFRYLIIFRFVFHMTVLLIYKKLILYFLSSSCCLFYSYYIMSANIYELTSFQTLFICIAGGSFALSFPFVIFYKTDEFKFLVLKFLKNKFFLSKVAIYSLFISSLLISLLICN